MKHHYVPQFLLRSWADVTPDGRVETFRLDLPNLPSSRHAPRFTAYENDLYALTKEEVAGMSRQAVETQVLRRVDDAAARVHQKLLSTGLQTLTHEDRRDWVRFIMSLRVRQPDIVARIRLEGAATIRAGLRDAPEEYEALATEDEPATLEEFAEKTHPGLIENFGLSCFHKLVNAPGTGNKLLRLTWWLWDFSGGKHELLLGDHPCIHTEGIDNPDLIIALPLGPRMAFLATASERVAQIMRRQDPTLLAMRLNESSIGQARVRVYARNVRPRRFIENRMRLRRRASGD